MRRIGIAAISDETTTARYFERAATQAGFEVVDYVSLDDHASLGTAECVIVFDPYLKNPAALRRLPCPSIGYLIDVHQEITGRLAYARYFDHVLIAQKNYLDRFEALPHASVHWVPLACDPAVHFVEGQDREFEVGFVGKFGAPNSHRFNILTRVLAQFHTNGAGRIYSPREMGHVYSRSKIVLNKSINGDLNMRVFEGLASGALLVTDKIANGLEDIGRDGQHFVTYSSVDEAIDIIRHYLAYDTERQIIARRGQELAFARHTYAHRFESILAITRRTVGTGLAPARSAPEVVERVWRSECLRVQGAPPGEVVSLLADGHLSQNAVANAAIAAVRGVMRPLRQRLSALSKPRR